MKVEMNVTMTSMMAVSESPDKRKPMSTLPAWNQV